MPEGTLKSTYTTKPLVDVDGESLFGELAIVRWLAKDGWHALWADTFHGRKFWRDMPHLADPVEPPAKVRNLYARIAHLKGSASGCFDVVGWNNDRIIWLEYKGPKDKPNRNEGLWIDAALRAGVHVEDLVFVGDTARGTRSAKEARGQALASRSRQSSGESPSNKPAGGLPPDQEEVFEPTNDQDYYAWLNSHPTGYVLSLKGKQEPVLHRTECNHIDRNNNTITKARKICSEDRRALGDWVRLNGLGNGIVLKKCPTCF